MNQRGFNYAGTDSRNVKVFFLLYGVAHFLWAPSAALALL